MSKSNPGPRPARPTSRSTQGRGNANTNANAKPRSAGSARSTGKAGNTGKARNTGNTRPATKASSRGSSAPTRLRTRHPVLFALVPVGLVVAGITTMVVIKATGGSGPAAAASHVTSGGPAATADPGTTSLAPGVVAALSVPSSALDTVGSPSSVTLPSATGTGSVLRGASGTPLITYIGAEYCPYCAAERWALAVALSRFGTFSNLSGTHSSSSDVYPNTQTLSFYGSSYSSPYVTFQPVEEATNQAVGGTYETLQTPTAAQGALMSSYDAEGSIPFLDIANKYVVTGASFSPQVLAGLSRSQIASQLSDPSSPVAQAVDGTANDITAAICTVTGNKPSSVCDTPAIQAIVKKLGA